MLNYLSHRYRFGLALMCALLLDGLTFDIDLAVTALSRRSSPLGVAAQLAEKRWLAYLPAVVPVWFHSTLYILYIPPYILLWIPPCPSGPNFDVSTWITINKSADFLIVTPQKARFTHILAENRLFDQKNGRFLDRNLITASASPLLGQKLHPRAFVDRVRSSCLSLPTCYSGKNYLLGTCTVSPVE